MLNSLTMKYRDKKNFIIVLLLLTIGGLLGTMVLMGNKMDNEKEDIKIHTESLVVVDQRNLGAKGKLIQRKDRNETFSINNVNNNIPVNLLKSEANYESTFRSCLGTNCFADPVVKEGQKVTRIGLLAPPLSGADSILAMLRKVGLNDNKDVEVILNTHVPAYGYGKNHGWSRIIRLVRRLVPHTHALISSADVDQAKLSATLDLQVRQLMRWHCRLSHVAAHTAMLTIFIDDFIERPHVELEKMLTFSGFKAGRPDILASVTELLPQLLKELKLEASSNGRVGVDGDVISSIIVPQNLHDLYTSAIDNEMKISKELTKWPCRSFKELETNEHSIILHTRFYDLSADCSNKYVKCSVQYDVNEQKQ